MSSKHMADSTCSECGKAIQWPYHAASTVDEHGKVETYWRCCDGCRKPEIGPLTQAHQWRARQESEGRHDE